MLENFDERSYGYVVNIKVIGIGGGGNNAVEHMMKSGLRGVDFWVANTDSQSLMSFDAGVRIYLGQNKTKGLGAGANPEVGKDAAIESEDAIRAALRGADMVFVAAGMGGGTGTGAAPIVAKIAKEIGALCVAIVTTPFGFEGSKRRAFASEGLQELRSKVDSLIVISNETLLQMFGTVPLNEAFKRADDILCQSVRAITSLITEKALINLDFADVRNIMTDKGTAMIGMGKGTGEFKAKEAATQAISSPLLGSTIKGAKNAIVNITCGATMTLQDANEAVEIVREAAGDNINIIFGVAIADENSSGFASGEDFMCVTVIATEFSNIGSSKIPFEKTIETPYEIKDFEETITPVVKEKKIEHHDDENSVAPSLEYAIPSFLKRNK